MIRNPSQPAARNSRPRTLDDRYEMLHELVAHLRRNRPQLRGEWARRIREAGLLTALSETELLSETASVYQNYLEVLETGSVEALQAYARNLSGRIIPRGVETEEVLGIVLLLRDVLARSLFEKYRHDFELLNRVLDSYEPAANRIASTVGVSFIEQRERFVRLRQVNEALEHRNAELATMNAELEKSREHYRRLFHEARGMQERLRVLSNRVLRVQEEERKRISRELHDEVGQALTAVNTNLGVLQREFARMNRGDEVPEPSFLKRVTDSQRMLTRAMDTVHSFAGRLRPTMLDELGLVPALRSYIKEYRERTGLRVVFEDAIGDQRLNAQQKIVLFRVAQESLTNVAKHARASHVLVTLRSVTNAVQMRIRDDGSGFAVTPPGIPKGKKQLGLLGMQERVRLVNGHLLVESSPGEGTTIFVEIPVKNVRRAGSVLDASSDDRDEDAPPRPYAAAAHLA